MNKGRIKVLFVIADMEGGGAQRVALNLISGIDREKFQPVLVLSSRRGEYLDEIPPDVTVYDLRRKGILSFPMLVLRLARVIRKERPDIIFSILFHANILSILAKKLSMTSAKAVISEHISWMSYGHGRHGSVYIPLIRALYPKADLAIAVSDGVRRDLVKEVGVSPDKAGLIYNPVELGEIRRLSAKEALDASWGGSPVIMNVGRLVPQKGHADLLKAFSIVRKKTDASLVIIGDGEEKKRLKRMAKKLGIECDIFFCGFRMNPFKYMARASVFVNSSLYEGFGYTIVEAMALGVPVVATACPHGPDEIITDGENGLLVPVADDEKMAEAILKALSDEVLRKRLSDGGKKRSEFFSMKRVISEYEALFQEVSGGN